MGGGVRPPPTHTPHLDPPTPFTHPQAAGVRYQADIVLEQAEDSIHGVGQAICERAEELGAGEPRCRWLASWLAAWLVGWLGGFRLGRWFVGWLTHCRGCVWES